MTNPFAWGYPFASDEIMGYDDILMDQNMQQVASPSAQYYSHFAPSVLNNFLKDGQRTAIFDADVPSNAGLKYEYYNSQSVGGTPIHRHPQDRFASPISTSEPSSASGSAHSPPADTEDPSSPPAEVLISPFPRQAPCGTHWNTPEHNLQFGLMGGPVACVNPIEVNSQQPDFGDNESESLFDFGRTNSYDSYTAPSQCDTEPASFPQTASVDMHLKRMSSPEDMQSPIKEEIEAYPESPLAADSGDEHPVLPRSPKRKADNDEEWKPSKKGKTNNARPAARPRFRSTKSAPESPPQAKKRNGKPNPEPSQVQRSQAQAVAVRRLPPQVNSITKTPVYCREHGCPTAKHPDKASLDAHIKKKHTRPYICVFHFAGCEATFPSKNEWKRHVNSQHILLNYWICQEDECSKTCNGPSPVPTNSTAARGMPRPSHIPKGVRQENIPNGSIFNRKDLYTQHMRRMHMPEPLKKTANGKKGGELAPNSSAAKQWEDTLRRFQEGAMQERCKLPASMACPAQGCVAEFHGPDAWDQRMEHVARHLDAASQGREPKVVFGGDHDACLTRWAGQEEVAIIARAGGRWVLVKGNGSTAQGKGRVDKGGVLMVGGSAKNNKSKVVVEVADEIVVGEENDDDDLDADGEPDI